MGMWSITLSIDITIDFYSVLISHLHIHLRIDNSHSFLSPYLRQLILHREVQKFSFSSDWYSVFADFIEIRIEAMTAE